MDERDSFLAVYREAGEQVRNISNLQNTLLGFFIVGLGAFIGLLAQQQGPEDNVPTKWVWLAPAFFLWSVLEAPLSLGALLGQVSADNVQQ